MLSGRLGRCVQKSVSNCREITRLTFSFTTCHKKIRDKKTLVIYKFSLSNQFLPKTIIKKRINALFRDFYTHIIWYHRISFPYAEVFDYTKFDYNDYTETVKSHNFCKKQKWLRKSCFTFKNCIFSFLFLYFSTKGRYRNTYIFILPSYKKELKKKQWNSFHEI